MLQAEKKSCYVTNCTAFLINKAWCCYFCQYRLQIVIINIISIDLIMLSKSLKYCFVLIIDLSLSFWHYRRHCPWTKRWIAWPPPFWNKQTYCSVQVYLYFLNFPCSFYGFSIYENCTSDMWRICCDFAVLYSFFI